MDFTYNGAYQICFWKSVFNEMEKEFETGRPMFSWDDFHLIPQKRPQVAIPSANYSMVSIPETSEREDITALMPGGLTYNSVSGSWSFIIDHSQKDISESWTVLYRKIEEYFDGSIFFVELVDDPGVLYNGRVWIASQDPQDSYSVITINYDFTSGEFDIPKDLFFRIRFLDFYERELQSDLLAYGDTPVFYKAFPDDGILKFDHWEPDIRPVDGSQDYIAKASGSMIRKPIVFYGEDGKVIEERDCVPLNMDMILFDINPIMETFGAHNILLEDFWRIPKNVSFIYADSGPDYPYEIRVAKPPNKIVYVDKDKLIFDGIVVKAYNEDGSLWTSGLYDDGIIPMYRLIFPVTDAVYNPDTYADAKREATSNLNIAPLQQPIPVGTTFDQSENNGEEYWLFGPAAYYDHIIGPNVMYYDTDRTTWCYVVIASANPDDTYYRQCREGDIRTAYTVDNAPLTSNFTYGGKTVYYAAIHMVNENYKREYGKPPIIWNGAKADGVGKSSIGAVAWTMVYGDITEYPAGSRQSIPVRFRIKGRTYETGFTITVSQ